MASLNEHTVVGRLGRDVEQKSGSNGGAYAYFSVATDDYVGKDADGKAKTETTWHDCKVFGKLAEIAGKYGRKGTSVLVKGRIEKKKDKDNDKIVYVNIIVSQLLFFGSNDGASNGNGNGNGNGTAATAPPAEDRGAARAGVAQAPPAVQTATQSVATGETAASDDLPF